MNNLAALERLSGVKPSLFGVVLPRGLALFLAGFSLLNFAAELRLPGFDANLWWIDERFLPQPFARVLELTAAIFLLAFAIRRPCSNWRRWLTLGIVGLLAAIATANCARFYLLLSRGSLRTGFPVAFSIFVVAALVLIFRSAQSSGRQRHAKDRSLWIQVAAACALSALAFPVLQMLCFGRTDYRRPADAAVVLGARVYADGRPSDALADRVRTACQIYRTGSARKLIFSGGPGEGSVSETESMKRMAIQLGVKPEDILLDPAGLNTRATVKNTEAIFTRLRASRILVVSHFYHLPRIKLAYARAGQEVYTVPARESPLFLHPYNMVREVAAFWVYYLRALA